MTEPKQAIVITGTVSQVVVMDPATAKDWTSNGLAEQVWPGATLVDVTDISPQPGIGWTYSGKNFTAPPPPPEPDPATEPAAS